VRDRHDEDAAADPGAPRQEPGGEEPDEVPERAADEGEPVEPPD
jgi:hypothetical protein